jgi:hypothetical protein
MGQGRGGAVACPPPKKIILKMNKIRADLSENMLTPVYFIKKFSTKIRPSFQLPPESISLLRL